MSPVSQKQKTDKTVFLLFRYNLNLNGNFIFAGAKFGVSFSLLGCSDISDII